MAKSGKVTVIPARRQVGNTIKASEKPKLRVAAYCRVSTDSEEQATSYEAQVEHYTTYINANPEWELAGIFADDGISGTNTKKRTEFNNMIEECMAGNIDMIITKSISRFARNTLDCLKYIRQLKEKNIPVLFEKESINTLDAKGEILLTIMASLAQQESQSLSQNVQMGIRFRYQQGKVQVNHNRFLGYTKDAEGTLVIVPEEAEVIRRIFREYLMGKSTNMIAAGLEQDGILTGAGKEKWWSSTITKILTNEKYMGDALLQKTYTTDFLTKTRVKNHGTIQQYYVEDDHDPIVSREIFMQVQDEMARRRKVKRTANGTTHSYSGNHCLAGRIICADCGEVFRRIYWYRKSGRDTVWRCESRLSKTGLPCHARTVKEAALLAAVMESINTVMLDRDYYMRILQQNIARVVRQSSVVDVDELDGQLARLQNQLLQKANSREAYDNISDEIFRLRELKEDSTAHLRAREQQLERIKELQDFLSEQPEALTEFDDALVARMVEQVTVYDTHYVIAFKSGVQVEVKG